MDNDKVTGQRQRPRATTYTTSTDKKKCQKTKNKVATPTRSQIKQGQKSKDNELK